MLPYFYLKQPFQKSHLDNFTLHVIYGNGPNSLSLCISFPPLCFLASLALWPMGELFVLCTQDCVRDNMSWLVQDLARTVRRKIIIANSSLPLRPETSQWCYACTCSSVHYSDFTPSHFYSINCMLFCMICMLHMSYNFVSH